MSPNEFKQGRRLWETASEFGKVILKITDGDGGLILVEKNEGVAAIVLGELDEIDKDKMVAMFKLFRSRLDDMIRHAEKGVFHNTEGDRVFIRDNETGEYDKVD